MQNCEFCGSELPGLARFCGNCGRVNATEEPTAISDVSALTWVSPDTPPINSSSQPFVGNPRTRQEDEGPTISTDWLGKGMIEYSQVPEESEALGPDLLLPGM